MPHGVANALRRRRDTNGSVDRDDALQAAQGVVFGLLIACMAWAAVVAVYLLVAP